MTVTCLTIVALSIGLYFRRWRSIPLTGAPAAMGTVMAFAVAELAFGYLNSSTAFLGSIIIGNGINYAIVLMSRYEEHRARGDDPEEALRCALGGTWRGTLVAAIAASAAYASLMVTSFRGFSQFGVMGATGALSAGWPPSPCCRRCWCCSTGATGGKRRAAAAPPRSGRPAGALLQRPAAASGWRSGRLLVGLVGLRHFLQDPFEYDFRKLERKLEPTEDAKQFGQQPQRPCSAAGPRRPSCSPTGGRGRADAGCHPAPGQGHARASEVIGQIVTIFDLLPGPPEVQRRKLGDARPDPQADRTTRRSICWTTRRSADLAKITRRPSCAS